MRLPTLVWFGCTNSTRLNPERLRLRPAAAASRCVSPRLRLAAVISDQSSGAVSNVKNSRRKGENAFLTVTAHFADVSIVFSFLSIAV